ncbi:hypothetical protein DFH07DRAFT_1059397 [Mycena maculata]|uniref:Uncharacterized protein n=1 Tax=Mycena maculata TaxID=230809 RepID=A0AAD7NJR6_9AGAR|nr:hypothetical protein DFH07DRAFT_1059397 [Mycena maculata]
MAEHGDQNENKNSSRGSGAGRAPRRSTRGPASVSRTKSARVCARAQRSTVSARAQEHQSFTLSSREIRALDVTTRNPITLRRWWKTHASGVTLEALCATLAQAGRDVEAFRRVATKVSLSMTGNRHARNVGTQRTPLRSRNGGARFNPTAGRRRRGEEAKAELSGEDGVLAALSEALNSMSVGDGAASASVESQSPPPPYTSKSEPPVYEAPESHSKQITSKSSLFRDELAFLKEPAPPEPISVFIMDTPAVAPSPAASSLLSRLAPSSGTSSSTSGSNVVYDYESVDPRLAFASTPVPERRARSNTFRPLGTPRPRWAPGCSPAEQLIFGGLASAHNESGPPTALPPSEPESRSSGVSAFAATQNHAIPNPEEAFATVPKPSSSSTNHVDSSGTVRVVRPLPPRATAPYDLASAEVPLHTKFPAFRGSPSSSPFGSSQPVSAFACSQVAPAPALASVNPPPSAPASQNSPASGFERFGNVNPSAVPPRGEEERSAYVSPPQDECTMEPLPEYASQPQYTSQQQCSSQPATQYNPFAGFEQPWPQQQHTSISASDMFVPPAFSFDPAPVFPSCKQPTHTTFTDPQQPQNVTALGAFVPALSNEQPQHSPPPFDLTHLAAQCASPDDIARLVWIVAQAGYTHAPQAGGYFLAESAPAYAGAPQSTYVAQELEQVQPVSLLYGAGGCPERRQGHEAVDWEMDPPVGAEVGGEAPAQDGWWAARAAVARLPARDHRHRISHPQTRKLAVHAVVEAESASEASEASEAEMDERVVRVPVPLPASPSPSIFQAMAYVGHRIREDFREYVGAKAREAPVEFEDTSSEGSSESSDEDDAASLSGSDSSSSGRRDRYYPSPRSHPYARPKSRPSSPSRRPRSCRGLVDSFAWMFGRV